MRIVLAGAALLAAVGLAGCTVAVEGGPSPVGAAPAAAGPAAPVPAGPAAPPAEVLVRDAEGRFGIVPPPGWERNGSDVGEIALLFVAPDPDVDASARTFAANVNVLVRPADRDLTAVVDEARALLPERVPDYATVADEPAVLPGGAPAHLLGGTFTDRGFALRNLQLFTVVDGRTLIVTGTALADAWGRHAAALDAALRTLTPTR